MSFFNNVEKVIQEKGDQGLIHLEHYYGITLALLRQSSKGDAYSKVHGTNAGGPMEKVKDFIGVLQGDDFFESNSTQRPSFVAGYLYTRETGIVIGDVIEIQSPEATGRAYKITKTERIGTTTEVFKRYKLSAMGD